MPRSALVDCQRCGACCCNPQLNRALEYFDYVAVRSNDAILKKARLARRFIVLDAAGEPHMRLDQTGERCAALRGTVGRSVECGIYEDRPTPCRTMEPGSERCFAARRDYGIEND
jgi:Fe-S-cluster containining protein